MDVGGKIFLLEYIRLWRSYAHFYSSLLLHSGLPFLHLIRCFYFYLVSLLFLPLSDFSFLCLLSAPDTFVTVFIAHTREKRSRLGSVRGGRFYNRIVLSNRVSYSPFDWIGIERPRKRRFFVKWVAHIDLCKVFRLLVNQKIAIVISIKFRNHDYRGQKNV